MEKLLATGQKVNHILDEMYIALFLAGAQEIQSRICRREEGVEITLTSDYDPTRRQRLESLARCLENARHAPALEETYWGLRRRGKRAAAHRPAAGCGPGAAAGGLGGAAAL